MDTVLSGNLYRAKKKIMLINGLLNFQNLAWACTCGERLRLVHGT